MPQYFVWLTNTVCFQRRAANCFPAWHHYMAMRGDVDCLIKVGCKFIIRFTQSLCAQASFLQSPHCNLIQRAFWFAVLFYFSNIGAPCHPPPLWNATQHLALTVLSTWPSVLSAMHLNPTTLCIFFLHRPPTVCSAVCGDKRYLSASPKCKMITLIEKYTVN